MDGMFKKEDIKVFSERQQTRFNKTKKELGEVMSRNMHEAATTDEKTAVAFAMMDFAKYLLESDMPQMLADWQFRN